MNTLLSKLYRILSLQIIFLFGRMFAIGPVIGGFSTLPVLGSIFFGSKAGSSKELLSRAADAILCIELLVLVLFVFSFLFLVLFLYSYLKAKIKQRRLNKIVELLTLLKSGMISEKDGEISRGSSRDDQLKRLFEFMKKPSFKKLLNSHLSIRFLRALIIVRENEVGIKDQINLIDRWQQTFVLFVK